MLFVSGPSTKTKPSALSHLGATGTICRLTYRLAQTVNISVSARQVEISEHYTVVNPQESFSLSHNNVGLLNFLCETWRDEEQLEPTLSLIRLYLGGGFKDETKGVLVTAGTVTDVVALKSTPQETDTRVILHSRYSVQNEDMEGIIIHANYTDIVVM